MGVFFMANVAETGMVWHYYWRKKVKSLLHLNRCDKLPKFVLIHLLNAIQ